MGTVLGAAGFPLRRSSRVVGAGDGHVCLATEHSLELVAIESGVRRELARVRTRALSGEAICGHHVVVPTIEGWSAITLSVEPTHAPRPLPLTADDHPLAAFADEGAERLVFTNPRERRITVLDAASGAVVRSSADASFVSSVDPRGIGFGIDGRRVRAVSLVTNESLWDVSPFEGIVTDAPVTPALAGDEVHVRAGTVGREGHGWIVARIEAASGRVLARHASRGEVPAWLPDLPAELEDALARLDHSVVLEERGLVFASVRERSGETGGVVFHVDAPSECVRVPFGPFAIDGRYLLGIAHDVGGTWLLAVALADLPRSGEACDLLVTRRGERARDGEDATVVMVMSAVPIFIVEHPVHGRVNVPIAPQQGTPKKGDVVVLEGVGTRAGGVVQVESYHLKATPARDPVSFTLRCSRDELPLAQGPSRPSILAPLRGRAEQAGVALPPELVAVVGVAEADATLHSELGALGFDFVVPDAFDEEQDTWGEVFPLWTNQYGETLGFLREGRLFVSSFEMPSAERDVGTNIIGAIRAVIAERARDNDDGAAGRAYVLDALSKISEADLD